MEVGSSNLPGTTHRRKAMCSRRKAPGARGKEKGKKQKGEIIRTVSFPFNLSSLTFQFGGLAQLARAPALHAGGQRFESVILHDEIQFSNDL